MLEQFVTGMIDPGRLAVHQPIGPDDLSTKRLADSLMAEADSEYGHHAGGGSNESQRYSGLARRTRTGGEDECQLLCGLWGRPRPGVVFVALGAPRQRRLGA